LTKFAIECRTLTKKFNGFTAVDNLNLKVRKGEIFGFIGPNGAGKTTAIRMICGVLSPSTGTAIVDDFDVVKNPEEVKQRIGYMAQNFILYGDLTTYENLDFYGTIYGLSQSQRKQRIKELLELVKLQDFENYLANELSGGMRNRLSLANALLHEPKILILDEPTAGVDPPLRRTFWQFFRELNAKGTTILVTTHYLDEAEHCDRLGMISNGNLIAEGSPTEIVRKVHNGDLVQVTVRDSEQDLRNILVDVDEIKEILFFRDIEPRGCLTHFVVENADSDLPKIQKLLYSKKIDVLTAGKVSISMEDAFIKLMEEGS
jgi:ABC-2 type transport system ATP-binding protein